MARLKGKKVVLGVGGGIAAYKACDVLRRLTDLGAEVHVVLTPAGQKFVTPLTFQSLSQNPVHTDLFNLTEESEMSHIKLADQADLILVAPATADILAKMVCGMAGDLLTTILLVTRAPVYLAPSMNVHMWEKPVVQQNLQILRERGYHIIEPGEGYLACGYEGKGRLADLEVILGHLQEPAKRSAPRRKKKILQGKKILINAGPTREYLDPVRFISNPSSGKMGFALAAEAQARGAEVILISGPVQLPTPLGVLRKDVITARQMAATCKKTFPRVDVFIATAAVGDYRPKQTQSKKIKKSKQALRLDLVSNEDILLNLARQKLNGQLVVGFAAETDHVRSHAMKKLKEKHLDLIVANDVSQKGYGFASDHNQVLLIEPGGKTQKLAKMPKTQVAARILDRIEAMLEKKKS